MQMRLMIEDKRVDSIESPQGYEKKKQVSGVGFEPTPTFVDQNALGHLSGRRISSLSLAP